MAAGLMLSVGPGRADDARIGFTTYLRAGPGTEYRPVDEALSGRVADVAGCEAGWCRVRIGSLVGFVPDGALTRSPPPEASGPQTCFVNRQAGYRRGRDLTICYAEPAKP